MWNLNVWNPNFSEIRTFCVWFLDTQNLWNPKKCPDFWHHTTLSDVWIKSWNFWQILTTCLKTEFFVLILETAKKPNSLLVSALQQSKPKLGWKNKRKTARTFQYLVLFTFWLWKFMKKIYLYPMFLLILLLRWITKFSFLLNIDQSQNCFSF